MFKKSLLIMLLMAFMAPWAAMGQTTVTIGSGTGSNSYYPVYTYQSTAGAFCSQQIYTSTEITNNNAITEGSITKLAFKTSTKTLGERNWDIFIVPTTKSSFDSYSDYVTVTQNDKVFSGTVSFPTKDTYSTITLDTPFNYDFVNKPNIIIMVIDNTLSQVDVSFRTFSSTNSAIYFYSRNSSWQYVALDPYDLSNITGGSKSSVKNQIQITFEIVQEYPAPFVTLGTVTAHTAEFSWTAPSTDKTINGYAYQYKEHETDVWGELVEVGSSVYGCTLDNLDPETDYDFRVKALYTGDTENNFTNVSFTTTISCPVPTGLTCTAYTATTATLEWTSTGAESYEIYLTDDATDEPNASSTTNITSSTNSKLLENLTAETPYYAYVRGNCGTTDGKSDWSAFCSFTPSAAMDITLYDYTNTNGQIPVYGTYADYGTRCQFIIPAFALENKNMESGASIKKLTFHTSTASTSFNEEFTVYLKEVSYATFENAVMEEWSSMTNVWTNTLTIIDNQLIIDFSDSPYTYHGGNLMIGFQVTNWGSSCPSISWYGQNQQSGTYTAVYNNATSSSHSWSTTINRVNFIPKTTITYIPGVEDPCHAPKDLNAENITASSAYLSWTKSESTTTCTLRYHAKINGTWGEWITKNDVADPYTSYTLNGLNANTQYEYQVMGTCGEGNTDWSTSYAFTTDCGTVEITPSTPFPTEGFENALLPTCWSGAWKTSTNQHHNGSRAAYSDSDDNVDMYMPTIHINADAAQLKFWSYTYYPSNYGKNSVLVSTDGGESYIQIWEPESVSANWTEVIINIPETYLNSDIIIAFRYEYNTSAGEYSRHAWFVDDVAVNAYKTYTKSIDGYTSNDNGWYLIASPVVEDITPSADNGFITSSTYDLYRFNQSAEDEWENWKQEGDHYQFKVENGKGYLYANDEDAVLTFTGTPYTGNGEIALDYLNDNPSDEYMYGWNLVGNPFGTAATVDKDYYRLGQNSRNFIAGTNGTTVEAMEGILVKAGGEGENVTFTPAEESAPTNSDALVVMNLSQNRGSVIDRAIVRFNESRQLPKFMLNPANTKIYIPQNGKDYAIATAEAQGEMPVNFKARENGTYTLTVNPENVEMGYLHLIDNMTGDDIDLLQTPSYSFNATSRDYESRFRLVFSANGENGASTGSATFAFFSNGNLIIGNEGEATLQVVDLTGRILSNETIDGCHSMSLNAAPGVYMIRLINGNNVKVQKIVVR